MQSNTDILKSKYDSLYNKAIIKISNLELQQTQLYNYERQMIIK